MRHLILLCLPYILFGSSLPKCAACHTEHKALSHLHSKQEWKRLSDNGGKALKEVHKKHSDAMAYLNSSEYNETEVFQYVSRYASQKEVQKVSVYTFETATWKLLYTTEDGNSTKAGKIRTIVDKHLKQHPFKAFVSLVLEEGSWGTDPGNAFMFFLTLGMSPVKSKKTVILTLKIDNREYRTKSELETTQSITGTPEKAETLQYLIPELMKEIEKQLRSKKVKTKTSEIKRRVK